jgi:hypothetical protein
VAVAGVGAEGAALPIQRPIRLLLPTAQTQRRPLPPGVAALPAAVEAEVGVGVDAAGAAGARQMLPLRRLKAR